MLGDLGINQFATVSFEPRERPFRVGADQPAIPRDICNENGGQPAFDAFPSESGAP
jgi:hypothetical protein